MAAFISLAHKTLLYWARPTVANLIFVVFDKSDELQNIGCYMEKSLEGAVIFTGYYCRSVGVHHTKSYFLSFAFISIRHSFGKVFNTGLSGPELSSKHGGPCSHKYILSWSSAAETPLDGILAGFWIPGRL